MKKKDGKQSPNRRKIRVENSIITQWMTPERLELISGWARDGYTEKEIAEKLGISLPTFRSYRAKNPELDKAVQNGKEVVDYKVEAALLKAALGGETTELKVIAEYRNSVLIITELGIKPRVIGLSFATREDTKMWIWQFLHKTAKITGTMPNAAARFISTHIGTQKNLPTKLCPKNNLKVFIGFRAVGCSP